MPKRDDQRESAVRISLVDVVYGIVLAYGFNFFDQLRAPVQYAQFAFAYTVIILDWIYVHRLYWGWEYKYNSFLVLDLASLFVMSRVLAASVGGEHTFVAWMSALFAVYVVWDVVANAKGLPCPYDWRWGLTGDLIAAILLAVVSLAMRFPFPLTFAAGVVGYFAAFATWFKKAPGCGAETTSGEV